MNQPKRVQRKRTKGWRMPPNCVSVTRPGPFGNPFTVASAREVYGPKASDAQLTRQAVQAFREWLTKRQQLWWIGPESDAAKARLLQLLPTLKGKDLACYCKPGAPCHADVLLELANREGGE